MESQRKAENSPRNKANWEAWRASAASGATTYEAREQAFFAEWDKQAKLAADEARPFLQRLCQPNDKREIDNKELLRTQLQERRNNISAKLLARSARGLSGPGGSCPLLPLQCSGY